MRRRFASLIIALAFTATVLAAEAVLAGPASAVPAFQPAIPGTAQGVVVSAAGRTVTVRFTGASAAVGRKLAGHRAEVACGVRAAPGLMFATRPNTPSEDSAVVRAARGDGTLTATLSVTGDFCQVSDVTAIVARAGLTPAGEAWADELTAATALFDAAYLGRPGTRYTPAATLVARGGGRIVALPGPDATPPLGQVGYWTDGGRHAAFVALSAAGRRLVYEDLDGRAHRTNLVEAYYDYVPPHPDRARQLPDSDDRERGVKGYSGDLPLTSGTGTGLRASVRGGRVVLRFTGKAAAVFRAIAGHRVTADCLALPVSSLLGAASPEPPYALRIVRVPRHGHELRLPPMAARDLCTISDDDSLVAMATPSTRGLRYITDFTGELDFFGRLWAFAALGGLDHVRLGSLDLGIPPTATTYPSAVSIVTGRPSLKALTTPDATPPKNVFGLWTDGGHQAEIVGTSRDGRRIFFADEGDGILRTNLTSTLAMSFAADLTKPFDLD
ncbi:hypothetical protein [Baekduia sp. Peel2402]|uniref:hypothetical protein n=1 Tax=Baekduia sp. Peel2402 TaxID=3458296 RepID=UPI00403E9F2A